MNKEKYDFQSLVCVVIGLVLSFGKNTLHNKEFLSQQIDKIIHLLQNDSTKFNDINIIELKETVEQIILSDNFIMQYQSIKNAPKEREKLILERLDLQRNELIEEKDNNNIVDFQQKNINIQPNKFYEKEIEQLELEGQHEKIISSKKRVEFIRKDPKKQDIKHIVGRFILQEEGKLRYYTAGNIEQNIPAYKIQYKESDKNDNTVVKDKIAYMDISFFEMSRNSEYEKALIQLLEEYVNSEKVESIVPTIRNKQSDGMNIPIEGTELFISLEKIDVIAVKNYLLDKYKDMDMVK